MMLTSLAANGKPKGASLLSGGHTRIVFHGIESLGGQYITNLHEAILLLITMSISTQ